MKEDSKAIVKIKIRAKIQYGPGKLAHLLEVIKTLGFNIIKSKTYLSPIKGDFVSKIVLEAKSYNVISKKLDKLATALEKESRWIEHVTQ